MKTVRTPEAIERARSMADAYRAGRTLQSIGDEYGITRERVRQLIGLFGLSRKDSPRPKLNLEKALEQAAARRERVKEKEAKRYASVLGCTKEVVLELTGKGWAWSMRKGGVSAHPCNAYTQQRQSAKTRGISWEMTFPEWWNIWQESGKWQQRGRGEGYCMARIGDSGPYAPNNVYICTIGQNFSDSYLVHPWHERFAGIHPSLNPATRGFSIEKGNDSKRNPFKLFVGKKYIGRFPTREVAEQAGKAMKVAA